MNRSDRRFDWRDGLSCAALAMLAFWVIYRFAEGTSPLRPEEYCWDSALFQTVGKLWAQGLTPYQDIFDHKGPLLFWIQKLAWECPNPRVGLYVIESLFVTTALWLCYAGIRLYWGRMAALGAAVLSLVFWLPLMEYGNLCETYCMPFLMLALYFQLRWLRNPAQAHPAKYGFVYGLCFGANLLIRPNNGIMICTVTFVIAAALLLRGAWKNLLWNALALIAGVAAAVLPFVMWFVHAGALEDMIYAAWTFNLRYAGATASSIDGHMLRSLLFFLTPAVLCLGVSVVCLIQKRWMWAAVNALSAGGTLLMTVTGAGYAHYFMLHVPLIALALCTMRGLGQQKFWRGALAVAVAGFVLLTVRTTLQAADWVSVPTEEEAAVYAQRRMQMEQLQTAIPSDKRSSVAVCGLSSGDMDVFLKTDLLPAIRYCFLMEWHAKADPQILEDYLAFLETGDAEYLILRRDNVGDSRLLKTIEENYLLIENHGEYELHLLKT